MSNANLTIGFARRGYSASGGAEAYLKRLADGVVELGHTTVLFTTSDWPMSDWTFGEIKHLRSRSPLGFAHELEEEALRKAPCDVLMSLERVRSCDVYRAGDGVHRAWLERRKKFETPLDQFLRRFNRKHNDIVLLEKALLDDRGAERVIANSKMVKDEIVDLYNYRPDRIDVVRNGVPLDQFRFDAEVRDKARTKLGLGADEQAILFVGSGWERKGLRFAIEAVESSHRKMRLFVAGRGSQDRYESTCAQFLGEVLDLLPIYAAADLFLLPTIYDPFSNACLEALACGLPVITTRANGFSEIMEDKIHGSIIDRADDVPALRKALDVWCDPTWRSAARSSILKRASQFDISKNIAQTIPILLQAATDAASRSGNMRKT